MLMLYYAMPRHAAERRHDADAYYAAMPLLLLMRA